MSNPRPKLPFLCKREKKSVKKEFCTVCYQSPTSARTSWFTVKDVDRLDKKEFPDCDFAVEKITDSF